MQEQAYADTLIALAARTDVLHHGSFSDGIGRAELFAFR
jgi:hypothetical protein